MELAVVFVACGLREVEVEGDDPVAGAVARTVHAVAAAAKGRVVVAWPIIVKDRSARGQHHMAGEQDRGDGEGSQDDGGHPRPGACPNGLHPREVGLPDDRLVDVGGLLGDENLLDLRLLLEVLPRLHEDGAHLHNGDTVDRSHLLGGVRKVVHAHGGSSLDGIGPLIVAPHARWGPFGT